MLILVDATRMRVHSASSTKCHELHVYCHVKWNIYINFVVKKLRTILYRMKYLAKYFSLDEINSPTYLSNVPSHISVKSKIYSLKIIYKYAKLYHTNQIVDQRKLLDIRQSNSTKKNNHSYNKS